jgi:menaquinone-9 beta-reductase
MYDLVIIGAGPAGCSAAIRCVRDGARVLLLERGRYPRQKVCGEFVSAESLDLLANLLASGHAALLRDAVRVPSARIFADGRLLQTEIAPEAASIARFDLDAALWESAQEYGVDVRQEVTVGNISGAGPFVVATNAGEIEARAVVNASGRWSNLTAKPQPDGPKWIGLKAHFAESSPSTSVDLYFFEGGYCGVQPVRMAGGDLRVNACAMVRSDVAGTLSEVFQLHPALGERAAKWQPQSEPVSTAPLLFRQPRPVHEHILAIGDAAGFVDPFVGDGISLALRSGALAAECLSAFFAERISLADAARDYAEEYQRRFGGVFRSSSGIRQMLQLPGVVRRPVLAMLQNFPVITQYFVKKTRGVA